MNEENRRLMDMSSKIFVPLRDNVPERYMRDRSIINVHNQNIVHVIPLLPLYKKGYYSVVLY